MSDRQSVSRLSSQEVQKVASDKAVAKWLTGGTRAKTSRQGSKAVMPRIGNHNGAKKKKVNIAVLHQSVSASFVSLSHT